MSCSTDIEHYQASTPQLHIDEYFSGELIAWGMVQDYKNQLTRRFCVEITGTWQNNVGKLAETFYFDDGEVSYRNWQLVKQANGRYQGSAEDVVGIAYGQELGAVFHWQYYLQVPIDGQLVKFFLDDWMYSLDQQRVFNRTKMKKFGVTLAEVTLFFDKSHPQQRCERADNE